MSADDTVRGTVPQCVQFHWHISEYTLMDASISCSQSLSTGFIHDSSCSYK